MEQVYESIFEKLDPQQIRKIEKATRTKAIRDCCNKWLMKERHTKKMLYERCIAEGVIEIDSYTQFMRCLDYLIETNQVDRSLVWFKKKKRLPPKLLRYNHLLMIAEKIRGKTNVQLAVAVVLGYLQCMRSGEVVQLKRGDIDMEANEITIMDGKWKFRSESGGGKTEVIPLLPDVKLLLEKYFEYAGITSNQAYLFPSPKNPNKNIKSKTLYDRFRNILKEVGLHGKEHSYYEYEEKKGPNKGKKKRKYHYYFHSLRHSGASAYLKLSSGNLDAVRRLLRHEDYSTTQVYAKLNTTDLRDVLTKAARGEIKHVKTDLEFSEKQKIFDNVVAEDSKANLDSKKIELDMRKLEYEMTRMDYQMHLNKKPKEAILVMPSPE